VIIVPDPVQSRGVKLGFPDDRTDRSFVFRAMEASSWSRIASAVPHVGIRADGPVRSLMGERHDDCTLPGP
jgi:hypothetical protein